MTEMTNRMILQSLKRRLDGAKANRLEELPSALWSYRTTSRKAMDESPFNLCFSLEALILAEVGALSTRNANFCPDDNDWLL